MSIYESLPKEKLEVNQIKVINQKKLKTDINDFYDNDIIIIDSGTATGKTRDTAVQSKLLKEKYKCNILSIVNLITLSREQINTFNELSKIELNDYQVHINKFEDSDGVICLNSLYKLKDLKKNDMSNTILYID